ncbi:MAG TPA: 2-hydroxyglutaryl-CoA dehydratase [Methanosarcinales archaeon]|nr:2-hydroxyglutaryl-CoA dehydratase [Methanosarcinales archaeon]
MITGLDVGSTTAKIIRLDSGKLTASKVVPSHRWKELLEDGNTRNTIATVKTIGTVETPGTTETSETIVSTGYFRKTVPHTAAITEITAASLGVRYYIPDAQVIVDVGGQDTKVIDLRNNTFLINDKCSAGTGAFLELAAHYFDIPVESLGKLHTRAKRSARINNTCGVFAISEMISQLVGGYTMEEVICGIHQAFARRIAQMIPPVETVVLIGGTVLNTGIVKSFESIHGSTVVLPPSPQTVNALGAALYGEKLRQGQ